MATIIMIGNMKGGVGKSTVTLLSANALSNPPFNKKIAVLDIDQQGSLYGLRKLESNDQTNKQQFKYPILEYSLEKLYQEIEDLDQQYDLIFLDVAGKLDTNLPPNQQEITPLLLNTDLLLIPFVAGNFATDATIHYLEYAIDVQQLKKEQYQQDLNIVGFVNMYIKNRKDDTDLSNYLGEIASETGLRFMQNRLGFYTAYRSTDTSTSLYRSKPNNAQEKNFKLWINELSKMI